MSIPFATKLTALLSKTAPEQIYAYKRGKLITWGSYSLSLTFLLYGISFADWSLSATGKLHEEESISNSESEQLKWYENAQLRYLGRTAGSIILSAIPLSLSLAALYIPTRVVTKIHYIPDIAPKCTLTTRTLFNKEKVITAPLRSIKRSAKKRVFTGFGSQGVDDKASFSFVLVNENSPIYNKFYIVNRSGKFWGSDGRFIDALFGGESIKDLQMKQTQSSTESKNNEKLLERMIHDQVIRPRMTSNSAKDIVMKNRK